MSTRLRLFSSTFALVALLLATAAPGGEQSASATRVHHPEERTRAPQAKRFVPSRAERAAAIAVRAVGTPYRWGGESPATGFDCSGLVRWAYGRVGVDVPHNSYALYSVGRPVAEERMEPGDVLFFEGLGHVGMYLGKGRMVHAPQSGRHVEVVRLARSNYGSRLVGARRVVRA